MYQDLLEMERKLDWTVTRKKVEVQDALARSPTVSNFHQVCALRFDHVYMFRQPEHYGYS
jgi:hypothetical protein